MKRNNRATTLPLRPDPFFFRLQWSPGAEWTGRALGEIITGASTIQLEATEPLDNNFLSFLQNLDNQPENFKLRLVLSSSQYSAQKIKELIGPLSRLKKLLAFILIINSRADEQESQILYDLLSVAASAGLKPKILVELEPETTEPELKQLVVEARQSCALEIALRPSRPTNNYMGIAGTVEQCLAGLKTAGLPVSLEECLPGIKISPELSEINCRQASGSCFIDHQGQVKACRQSEIILGDLKQQKLAEIWPGYLYAREVCPAAASVLSDPRESAINYLATNSSPVNLDSALRPVPLFTLKKKEWGAVLIKDLDSLVLSPRGEKLARLIDGKNTLGSIKKKFGLRSAGFIYALFLKGLVRLEK